MDEDEKWCNYTALGYLKFALEGYNKSARQNNHRQLTSDEVSGIINSMCIAFDLKTVAEASTRG